MTVGVELGGRVHQVELRWDLVLMLDGRRTMGWWLVAIDGVPRPRGKDVAQLYQRALLLASKALKDNQPALPPAPAAEGADAPNAPLRAPAAPAMRGRR